MNDQKEKVSEHYRTLEIEPFEIIEKDFTPEEQRGYYKGNILKYTLRDKGQNEEDAVKIQVYAEKLEDLELKVRVNEILTPLDTNPQQNDEVCLLEELAEFIEESIQHRQAIMDFTDDGHIKTANQYVVAGMRTVLSKIESLKEEYENLDNDWYDDFDNWGNPYDKN